MANSYTQLTVHIVIVTNNRETVLTNYNKEKIYKYITGIIQARKSKLIVINGHLDHIHILIGLNPDDSISELVKEAKRSSTNYINENKLVMGKFSWQKGYAAFSCSKSSEKDVIKYIQNQENHHSIKTFREEYIEFLKKYEIDYDEKYIFK